METDTIPDVKQVIVIRRDLKMRFGKAVAQACHASSMFLADDHCLGRGGPPPAEEAWLCGTRTKVVLAVSSEEDLLAVHDLAVKSGLRSSIVTDAGKTEFRGVPTRTAVAIGPDYSEAIDRVTGKESELWLRGKLVLV